MKAQLSAAFLFYTLVFSAGIALADDPSTSTTTVNPQDAQSIQTMQSCLDQLTGTGGMLSQKWLNDAGDWDNASRDAVPPFAGATMKCQSDIEKVKADIASCNKGSWTAGHMCIEALNQDIGAVMPYISGGMTALSTITSVSEACEKQSSLMNLAKDTLAAYNVACGGAKLYCENSCQQAVTDIAAAKSDCNTDALAKIAQVQGKLTDAQASMRIAENNPTPDEAAIATLRSQIDKYQLDIKMMQPWQGDIVPFYTQAGTQFSNCYAGCQKYTANLVAGGLGLLSSLVSGGTASSCTTATTASTAVDCTIAANASNQTCVCLANPNAAGCSTASTGVATAPAAVTVGTTPVAATGAGGLGAPTLAAQGAAAPSSSGAGSDGGGGGGSSPSGLGVGGAASNAKAGTAIAKDAASNSGGVGGGGGGSGSSGGGYADAAAASGGASAKSAISLSRNPASEVSGKAGKSNWDKISNTYLQMSSNLMK